MGYVAVSLLYGPSLLELVPLVPAAEQNTVHRNLQNGMQSRIPDNWERDGWEFPFSTYCPFKLEKSRDLCHGGLDTLFHTLASRNGQRAKHVTENPSASCIFTPTRELWLLHGCYPPEDTLLRHSSHCFMFCFVRPVPSSTNLLTTVVVLQLRHISS